MMIPVVDKDDRFVRLKNREDRNTEDIIRIACLWIINNKKECLISQRSLKKATSPGKWSASVLGTVEGEDSYLDTIIRETQEELGVEISEKDIVFSEKKYIDKYFKYFCMVYVVRVEEQNLNFRLQEDEVEQVRWIKISELVVWYKDQPDDFAKSFQLDSLLEFLKDN